MGKENEDHGTGTGAGTVERVEDETRTPRRYQVLMHNDHYTTMDFVVHVLTSVFYKPMAEAEQIMLNVHRKSVGLCGVYTAQIAEAKIRTVHDLAKENGFPLRCTMEPE